MSKKLFLSKRSCAFFFLMLFAGLGIAFKGPIFHFVLIKYVSHKIPLKGDWDFNYSYLSLQEKGVAFHDIRLYSKEEDIECKIGRILCKAPAIENVSISNHFIIEDLELDFKEQMHSKSSLTAAQTRSILHTLRQVEIKNGIISIPGKKMQVMLKESISSQKLGDMIFSLEGEGQVKLELSSWANNWIIDIEAKQSSIAFYKEFLDFFTGNKISHWNLEKGRLDGRAFLSIASDNEVKDARMHLSILDGRVRNDVCGILSSFDKVFVDVSYPMLSDADSFIENIKISSSVDRGEISVVNEKGENRFCFKDLSGYFTIDAFKEAAMEISGFVDDSGRLLPVKLLGKPALKNQEGLEIDLALELEPVFGNSAHVNVICSHENGSFLVKSRLDSLEGRQMLILQESLSLIYPNLRNYSINKGSYSGDLILKVNKEGIEELALRNLSFEDVGIYSKLDDVNIEAKKITAELEIELFDKKKTAVKSWKLDLCDGSVIVGREEELPYFFENTNIQITSQEGKFVDSYLVSEARGIKGRVNIDGTYERPVFDVLMTSKGEDALNLFTEVAGKYDNDLVLSSRIEKVDGKYSGSSIFTIQKDKHINEVAFEWSGTDASDLKIDFSSEDFSGDFFPFLNEITNYDWSLSGNYSFNGCYTNDELSVAFEGSDCTYKERNSYIKDAKGSATFSSSFEDGWRVDVHLTDGHKKVIDGRRLVVEKGHLQISSDDVYFKVRDFEGHLELEEISQLVYVHADKCDFHRDGSKEFDFSMHNAHLELCKLAGVYKDRKVQLDDSAHLLDRKIGVHACNFDTMHIAFGCLIDSEDICLPKMVRDREFGEFDLNFSLLDSRYTASLCGKDLNIYLEGMEEHFTVNVMESEFTGKIEKDKILINGGRLTFNDRKLEVDSLTFDRNGFFISGNYREKDLGFKGEVHGNFSSMPCYRGKGKAVYYTDYNRGLTIESLNDFAFTYDKKLMIKDALFSVKENKKQQCEFHAKSIIFHDNGNKISLHGVEGAASKKALKDKLGIDIIGDEVNFAIDADILREQEDFWLSGHLGRNKYMFLERETQVDGIHFRGNKKAFIFDLDVPLYDSNIDVCAHLFFDDKLVFHIDGTLDGKNVLEVDGSRKDGEIDILRLKGDLQGVAFDLTPSRDSGKNVFASEMSLDFLKMRPFLPAGAVGFIDRMELGKGIELIGDLNLDNSLTFTGIIKGTDFDFIDHSISSLFGKIHYAKDVCKLKDFSVVDRSFTAECKEATFDTRGEGCLLNTKNFQIKNFRPCLLSKKGERKKVSSPLCLDDIEFYDIKGNLADLNTVKGKGNIHFINTFDRQKNIVYDFAKEIIGRIGLDPVLMVPVVGEIDFTLADGKMNFIKMQNSFSDSKRSYFYLWHKSHSFLDYDGNLHIDIRMKQHVLFKFAELFIISLDGPVSSPKIFLK